MPLVKQSPQDKPFSMEGLIYLDRRREATSVGKGSSEICRGSSFITDYIKHPVYED